MQPKEILRPFLLLLISVIGVITSLQSLYRFYRGMELAFARNASTISIFLLTVLQFQNFGVFMSLGLNYSPSYFQYLTLSGISAFLVSMTTNKLSIFFYMAKNLNNPRFHLNGLSSPRFRFQCSLIVLDLILYLAAFFIVKYPLFGYYILPFYLYPFIHVMNACYNGNRSTFRW